MSIVTLLSIRDNRVGDTSLSYMSYVPSCHNTCMYIQHALYVYIRICSYFCTCICLLDQLLAAAGVHNYKFSLYKIIVLMDILISTHLPSVF